MSAIGRLNAAKMGVSGTTMFGVQLGAIIVATLTLLLAPSVLPRYIGNLYYIFMALAGATFIAVGLLTLWEHIKVAHTQYVNMLWE